MTKLKNNVSDFWLPQSLQRDLKSDNRIIKNVARAKAMKGLKNFSKILSGKQIPIEFNSSDSSYTSGKNIVIGSNLTNRNITCTAALVMHEASHISFTDENFFNVNYFNNLVAKKLEAHGYSKNFSYSYPQEIHQLFNWVEDRRIDNLVIQNFPGYKPYYKELYKEYFINKTIDKMIASSHSREFNFNSYLTRIVNFINPTTLNHLDALPGLNKIYSQSMIKYQLDVLNENCLLSSSEEALDLAINIWLMIREELNQPFQKPQDQSQEKDSDENDNNSNNSNQSSPESSDESSDNEESDKEQEERSDNTEKISSNRESNNAPTSELSKAEEVRVDNLLKKQQEFNDHESDFIGKGKLSKIDSQIVNDASKGLYDIETENVNGIDTTTIAINEPSLETIMSGDLDHIECLTRLNPFTDSKEGINTDYINKGVSLGKQWLRSLKYLDGNKTNVRTHLKSGRINKRILHSVPSGYDKVFQQIQEVSAEPIHIHLTIDTSGSMHGQFFNDAMTTISALFFMSSKLDKLSVSVTFISQIWDKQMTTVALNLSDSRNESFALTRKKLNQIKCGAMTPDVLAFTASMKWAKQGKGKNLWIHIADGGANSSTMGVKYGTKSTKEFINKKVKEVESAGWTLLPIFIAFSNESLVHIKESLQEKLSEANRMLSLCDTAGCREWVFFKLCYPNGTFVSSENLKSIIDNVNNSLRKTKQLA